MTSCEYFMDYFDCGENRDCLERLRSFATGTGDSTAPILLLGKSGLGKTHLLRAMERRIQEAFPGDSVLYQTGADFTGVLIRRICNRQDPEEADCYQSLDVLLVDDLSDLCGKESTQYEVLRLFAFLRQNNTRVICTALSGTIEKEGIFAHFPGEILELSPLSCHSARRFILHRALTRHLSLSERSVRKIIRKAMGNASLINGAIARHHFFTAAFHGGDNPASDIMEQP